MKCPAKGHPADDVDVSYSLTHLAHRWGVSRRDVRQLLQQGRLPFVQVEAQLRVPTAEVRIFESTSEMLRKVRDGRLGPR